MNIIGVGTLREPPISIPPQKATATTNDPVNPDRKGAGPATIDVGANSNDNDKRHPPAVLGASTAKATATPQVVPTGRTAKVTPCRLSGAMGR